MKLSPRRQRVNVPWRFPLLYARVESEGGNGNGWLGGIILNLFPSTIQLACVNSPDFRVVNNIGKLVFWKDVS